VAAKPPHHTPLISRMLSSYLNLIIFLSFNEVHCQGIVKRLNDRNIDHLLCSLGLFLWLVDGFGQGLTLQAGDEVVDR